MLNDTSRAAEQQLLCGKERCFCEKLWSQRGLGGGENWQEIYF